jgi:hypothetical protein
VDCNALSVTPFLAEENMAGSYDGLPGLVADQNTGGGTTVVSTEYDLNLDYSY